MPSPNAFPSRSAESNESSAESLRELSQSRGDMTNDVVIKERMLHDERAKRIAEIEAALRAAGFNPEDGTSLNDQEISNEPSKQTETIDESIEDTPATVGEKAIKHPRFRNFVKGLVIGVTASIAVTGVGAFAAHSFTTNAAPKSNMITNAPIVVEVEDTKPNLPVTEVTFENNVEKGIIDGYNKDGMWLSDSKPNTVAFSDFEKVIKNSGGSPKEALKTIAGNMVESKADYISALPDAVLSLAPQGSILSSFKGLNEAKTADRLENQLSPEEFTKLSQEFNDLFNQAEVKEAVLNGKYSNAYMAIKDASGLLGSKAALEKGATINHENMQLIVCHTNEKNTKAYEFSWKDGNGKVLGSILIKGPCAQAVEAEGSGSKRFVGLPEATEKSLSGGGPITIITGGGPAVTPEKSDKPDKPDEPDDPDEPDEPDDPTPPPDPDPDPDWGKSGDPHGGDLVTPSELVDPSKEVTKDYIENVNEGDRGYIDDNQAAPGSSSESNGVDSETGFADSGIISEGASTDEGRLEGGENQGGGETNGENTYHDEEKEEEGKAEDESGNEGQSEAQEDNEAGGDNNSDSKEENRVAERKF